MAPSMGVDWFSVPLAFLLMYKVGCLWGKYVNYITEWLNYGKYQEMVVSVMVIISLMATLFFLSYGKDI